MTSIGINDLDSQSEEGDVNITPEKTTFKDEEEVEISEKYRERENVEILIGIIEDESPISDVAEFRKKVKECFTQVLIKIEEDACYRQNLEEEFENLEVEYNKKSYEVERISTDAQDAIEDCKIQAEEISEAMMYKLSHEVNQRLNAEKLVKRLQKDCSGLQKLLKEVTSGSASSETTFISDLQYQLTKKDAELASLRAQRNTELNVLLSIADHLEQKIADLHTDKCTQSFNLKLNVSDPQSKLDVLTRKVAQLTQENLFLKKEIKNLNLTDS